jgi:hypothetical protein
MDTVLDTNKLYETIDNISIEFGNAEMSTRGGSGTTESKTSFKNISDDFVKENDTTKKFASWGSENLMPDEMINLVANNTIALGLIDFRKDMIVGPGHYLYKSKFVSDNNVVREEKEIMLNSQIQDYLDENDFREYMMRAAMDYSFFGNTFTEAVQTKDKKKYLFASKDASDCRLSTMDKNGKIKKCYLYNDWANLKEADMADIEMYDKALEMQQPTKFIYHAKSYFPGSKYYGVANWIGARNWLTLTNKIPIFKISNMENGSNVRFHFQVPNDYFDKLYPTPKFSDDERRAKELEFKKKLEEFLSGEKNAGKMILSKFSRELDKVIPGLIIEPISYKLNDDAYLPDFEQSNQAFTSAIGIDPSIANIQMQGKLSSGSDKRNGFNIYTNTRLFSAREKILEPIYKIFKLNGFDKDVRIGFKDFELQTLDENKTGIKEI